MSVLKSWLKQTIAELEQERDATPGVVNEDAVMALQAMHIALASLEAEPVCYLTWRQGFRAPDDCEEYVVEAKPDDKSCDGSPAFPVYTAPPAPVSVPYEVTEEDCPAFVKYDITEVDEAWARGFNACRAAMLQGAEPVTTAYKLPEGWVACSERLPEETKEPDGGATGYLVLYAKGKEPNGGFSVGVWNVTYLRR